MNATVDHTRAGRNVHIFETDYGCCAFVVNGSRIYSVAPPVARELAADDSPAAMAAFGLDLPDRITDTAPGEMPVRSLSLAVAQKCNLGCTYCYAQQGGFGSDPKRMETEAAFSAIQLLFREAEAGQTVQLIFLGGEPLMNRPLIRESTALAARLGRERSIEPRYSITTNGTLVTPEDGEFFERHGFSVTVSLDGVGEVHDALRPFANGQGSYARVLKNIRPLLAMQRRMQVSARVTVTPRNLRLRETLDELLGLGFHSVGFSPLLHAPSGREEMHAADLRAMLAQMEECGREFERRTEAGERYGFSNLATALQQIHRGTNRPYPCGAGGGYLGVSADGELFACHRFVEDADARFGDVWSGVDREAQARWLDARHVHRQFPCAGCWARYLCGGGCHHEVIHRGRPACEYIRGWLEYCLRTYVRMQVSTPGYFE